MFLEDLVLALTGVKLRNCYLKFVGYEMEHAAPDVMFLVQYAYARGCTSVEVCRGTSLVDVELVSPLGMAY